MKTWLLAALLLLPLSVACAADLTGRVVAVNDGDTLTVLLPENVSLRVRLTEIDAPESGQPYGNRAKQALSALVFGQEVRLATRGKDRYGRTLARLSCEGLDVNAELVRQGAAWAFRRYLTDPSLLVLEEEARTERRGLWALPEAERRPPWVVGRCSPAWSSHRDRAREPPRLGWAAH